MEKLGLDIKLLIAQLTNFVLFFLIFKKFISKPFSSFLEREKAKDKEKERIIQDLQKRELQLKEEENKLRKKMEKEYEEQLNQAKKEALELRKKIIDQAKKEAQDIVNKARQEAYEEKAKIEKEMKKKIIDLSIYLVEKVLKTVLTEDLQRAVTQKIIKDKSFLKDIN